jgi:alkylation response protein AidB-like acyl-CoA dehydrogenase
MDFGFTEKEKTLRKELKEFAKAELPPDWFIGGYAEEYGTEYGWQLAQQVTKKLAQKHWLTMAWPKKYGGLDAKHTEYLIYREEMAYNMVPGTDMGCGGVSWIGQSLIIFGNEEQKKKHLPGISAGETYWCTGYSEPEAGSDLASLKCKAVRKGNEYIVNGQKVWTTAGHRASWCWLAVRTNPDAPKHQGISLLLVDLKTSGVTVKPLVNMAGLPENCELFFDDARVPVDCLVGQENHGWQYIMTALSFERTAGIDHLSRSRRILDEIMKYSQGAERNGRKLNEDVVIRHKLADCIIECEIGRLMCYNIAWMEDKGLTPGYEASMAKNFCSELGQRIANVSMTILGLHGQLEAGQRAPVGGAVPMAYLYAVGDTIGGGTSEINRTLIATRGLGLPRG